MAEQTKNFGSSTVTGGNSRRRRLLGIAVLIVALVGILGLISFMPSYIARHLFASSLTEFGIEYDGLDTLKINPWKREAWIGPLRLRTGDSDHAQLGKLAVKINLFPLAKKHAMVERIIVSGIDIHVVHTEDGAIKLNGINLNRFSTPDNVRDESTPWGLGLADFELRDTRVIFHDQTGGELVFEIQSLLLGDFMTWLPDEEGSFEFKARINDVDFDWSGRIRPFSEDITLVTDARIREAALAKLVDFTGDFGLKRYGGVFGADIQLNLTRHSSGQVSATTIGTIEVNGADFQRADTFALAADRMDMDINTRFILDPQGDIRVDGGVTADIHAIHGSVSEDRRVDIERLNVDVPQLHATVGSDGSVALKTRHQIDLSDGAFSGRIQLTMDSLLNILNLLQSLSTGEAVAPEQTGLGDWAGGALTLPKSDIKVAQLQNTASNFELNTTAGEVKLRLAATSKLSGIEVVSDDQVTTVDTLHNELSAMELHSGAGKLSLRMAGNGVLTGNHAKGSNGELSFETIETRLDDFGLEVESGSIGIETSTTTAVTGSKLLAYAINDIPEASASIGKVSAKVKKGTFSLSGKQLQWRSDADSIIEDVIVKFGGGDAANAKFQRLELRDASADQDLNIGVNTLNLTGLDIALTRRLIDSLLAAGETPPTTEEGQNESVNATPPPKSLVIQVQRRLNELGYDAGPVDGSAGRRTRTAIRAFEKKAGLPLTGRISDQLLVTLNNRTPEDEDASPFEVKLTNFTLEDGMVLRFRDTTVQPQVSIDMALKTFELRNVDTRDPDKRAETRLVAKINEFTQVELNGWANALGKQANGNISSKVENLVLHTYSPYTAQLGGVNLESGQLNTSIDAVAEQGNLRGAVNLKVQDLEFTPLSEQDAKRLSDQAGFPIQTAMGLLQDSKGRIKLTLPIGGTVVKPDLDISSAINKAIGSALKMVFPPTLLASIISSAKGGSDLSFEPINFAPGAVELDDAAKKYADKLVTLLQDRPKISLKVCGRATSADFTSIAPTSTPVALTNGKAQDGATETRDTPAAVSRAQLVEQLGTQLHNLAIDRTRNVRNYLVTKKGIAVGRVGECRPTSNADDLSPPRVHVSL